MNDKKDDTILCIGPALDDFLNPMESQEVSINVSNEMKSKQSDLLKILSLAKKFDARKGRDGSVIVEDKDNKLYAEIAPKGISYYMKNRPPETFIDEDDGYEYQDYDSWIGIDMDAMRELKVFCESFVFMLNNMLLKEKINRWMEEAKEENV
jgi:hypothetical protein